VVLSTKGKLMEVGVDFLETRVVDRRYREVVGGLEDLVVR
jgi:hypothetical protein